MIDADEFLEYADVFGNYYGTARRFLTRGGGAWQRSAAGYRCAGSGADPAQDSGGGEYFYTSARLAELWKSRLRNRGSDSEEVIRRRLDTARREIENYSKYDYILVNNLLDQSAEQLKSIVLAERLVKSRAQLSEEERRLVKTAESCQLEQARERVQPILASFHPQVVKAE